MIFGIDSASVAGNRNPDWTKAKATGPISFAFVRSNYGTTPDKVFARDWALLKQAGLVRGAYLFLRFPQKGRAAPTPEAQAGAAIATIGDLEDGDLPPALDVEFPGKGRSDTGLSIEECLDRVRAAWTVMRGNYGVAPFIYTSARVWRDDLGNAPAADLTESPLWLARYFFKSGPAARDASAFSSGKLDPPVPPPWGDAGNWWIHQYQGDATKFPGMTGNVDMNRFNVAFKGGRGGRVAWAQRRLAIAASGRFDAATDDAVRGFQSDNRLISDGVIGPRTFAYLARVPSPA
jgi:lysozyme